MRYLEDRDVNGGRYWSIGPDLSVGQTCAVADCGNYDNFAGWVFDSAKPILDWPDDAEMRVTDPSGGVIVHDYLVATFLHLRAPVVSEKAAKCFQAAGMHQVQYLPVALRLLGQPKGRWYILNALLAILALDVSRSVIRSGIVTTAAILDEHVPPDLWMFRLQESLATLVVRQEVKVVATECGLTGFSFGPL